MQAIQQRIQQIISIHALREEGDFLGASFFLSYFISIHALREEGDLWMATTFQPAFDFYPRPPRGGRRLFGFERLLAV